MIKKRKLKTKAIIKNDDFATKYYVEITKDMIRFFEWLEKHDLISDETTLEMAEEIEYEKI